VAWAVDLVPGDRAWRTAAPGASWYRRAGNGLSVACMALAMAPDLDLGFTRHRTYTHSIGAVIVVGLLSAAFALRRSTPSDVRRRPLRIGAMCAAAYASHLFLDWLGVDLYPPPGLQVFWPFDSGWYISGLDLFRQTRREHLFTWPVLSQNFLAIAQETAILLPVAVALWSVRIKALARFSAEQPRRNHPPQ
jgi:LexA-binding, inner membrane-associated putative hydrolase